VSVIPMVVTPRLLRNKSAECIGRALDLDDIGTDTSLDLAELTAIRMKIIECDSAAFGALCVGHSLESSVMLVLLLGSRNLD
jgi:hypothetical protein